MALFNKLKNTSKEEEKEQIVQKEIEEKSPQNENDGEFDPESIDKEEVIKAVLSGDDDKLIELLKGFGASKEEIFALKENLLKDIREALYEEDLQLLNERFKGLNLTKITDIPNFKKFATLRSEGLETVEAFIYANPQYFKSGESDRGYIRTGSFTNKSGGNIPIPENELKMWRSAFPNDSDEELIKRYNKAIKA